MYDVNNTLLWIIVIVFCSICFSLRLYVQPILWLSSLFSTLLSINCHCNQFLQHQPFVVIHLRPELLEYYFGSYKHVSTNYGSGSSYIISRIFSQIWLLIDRRGVKNINALERVQRTISNTRATFAYHSFCDNLRLQCTSQTIVMVCCRFSKILNYFLLRKSDVIKITRSHSMAMMIVMVSTDLVKLINSDKLCDLLK